MNDRYKTKQKLIEELVSLRRQVAKLERKEKNHKKKEEELRQVKARTESTLDSMTDTHMLFDRHWRYLYVNKAAARAIGRQREEILRCTLWELYPDIIDTELDRQYHRAMDGRLSVTFDFHYTTLDTWWENRFYPVPEGLAVFATDITRRKKAEYALRDSEERYKRLVEGSPAIVWSFSNKRGTFYVSSRVESILGYSPDFLYANPWLWNRSIHPDDQCLVAQAIKDLASGKDLKVEYRIKDSSGNWRWLHDRSVGRQVREGEAIIEGISIDITERKRAEEALRESEIRFREMFENMGSGVAIYRAINDGEDFVFTDINPAGVRIGRQSREEVVGRSVQEMYPGVRDLGLFDVFKRVWKTGKPEQHPAGRYQDDRLTIWVENYLCKLPSGEIVAIYEDSTERKKVEEERERYLKQIRRSREQLKRLSHRLVEVQEAERRDLVRKLHDEVGQELTALSLNLNIVRSQLPSAIAAKLTTRMDDSLNLVERVLERIRDLMADLRPQVLDDYGLTAALHWYSKQFSDRTGISPVLQLEELSPRLPLPTETAFFRIAQEALTNVAKYARTKHVTVALEGVDGEIRLTIADDGTGFDSPAYRRPGARPQWGLINMKERAQAVGGRLYVETAPEMGTKIVAEVPRNHYRKTLDT